VRNIVSIRVHSMYESCQRTTYYVDLKTDEGFVMTAAGHATGSVYTDFVGLTKEEARERALLDAYDWADFLQLEVDPLVEEGVEYKPKRPMARYTTRRVLAARKAAPKDGATS
jgi:hypothetical protein